MVGTFKAVTRVHVRGVDGLGDGHGDVEGCWVVGKGGSSGYDGFFSEGEFGLGL